MIRRSVRKRFHTVYWQPPSVELSAPVIFVPNHHGWFDGYLMFHVVKALNTSCLDWIQEFDAFPWFEKIGGMPYPLNDLKRRGVTVKKTIRMMNEKGLSLLLFAEAELHYPPELLPFGKALETVADKVPNSIVMPVAIHYEMSMHERPEAFIGFGNPVEKGPGLAERTREAVLEVLTRLRSDAKEQKSTFSVLAKGTPDVNERWDLRKWRK